MYNSSIYPVKINKYQAPNNPVQNNEEEGNSGAKNREQEKEQPTYNTFYKPTPGYYAANFGKIARPQPQNAQQNTQPQNPQQQTIPQHNGIQKTVQINPQNSAMIGTAMPRQSFPNGEKTAIDYTQSKINISQVIKDFKSTTEAIGSPDDIKDTVYTYISLVQKEAEKESPNKKIIQSNLKNASQVLDEYITDTLKKPSNVVEGWIDSLFLQNVDYKYDESVVNPDYLVKLPPKKNTQTVEQNSETQPQQITNGNRNPYLDSLISAKKEQNPAEALNMYEEIITSATESKDSKALSIAYFESGKLYDKFDSLDKALANYTSAIQSSNDDGLKAQAYMKIAQIHHDSANIKDAGENYFSSIAYFGQTENLKAQAVLLSQTGKLVSEEYDKENANDFFTVADSLAKEIKDTKLSAKINQKAGEAFRYMNEPKIALDYYKTSASTYDTVQDNKELAKDYQAAAQLMLELGNPHKARTLLNKAFKAGIKTEDNDLIKNIQSQIAVLNA